MAAPTITNRAGDQYTFRLTAAADTVTMDLPSPGGTNLAWIIDSIFVFANGTITASSVDIQSSVAASQAKIGGQAGLLPTIQERIVCKKGDAAKIVLVCTGSTETWLTVNAHVERA